MDDVNKVIRSEWCRHWILDGCNANVVIYVNEIMAGKRSQHDVDYISYNRSISMSTEDKWEWPWRKKIFILSTFSTLLYWRYRFSKGNWTRMWTMIELSLDYNAMHELAHGIFNWTKQTMKYTKTCKVRPSQNCDYPPK